MYFVRINLILNIILIDILYFVRNNLIIQIKKLANKHSIFCIHFSNLCICKLSVR